MSIYSGYDFLERHPNSAYRQLFVKGTQIRAATLVRAANQPVDSGVCRTPEDIAEDYGVPIGAVYEALRYCESNPIEIAMDQRAEQLLIEAHGMNHPGYASNPKKHYRPVSEEDMQRIDQQLQVEFGRTEIAVKAVSNRK